MKEDPDNKLHPHNKGGFRVDPKGRTSLKTKLCQGAKNSSCRKMLEY